MWTSLVFLAIVGFAAGAQSPWKANQEYTYNIYARTLTAIPDLKDQYVGVVTKGKLILQAKGEGQLYGKLVKIGHAHYHDNLVGGWDFQIQEQSLNFQESELNNKQFILATKNGVIQSIRVDGSMTNDQVNQLKAILSQLQLDINGENLTKCKHNQLPEGNDKPTALFKTMEATVTGECETVYDIEPLPEYMVNHTYPRWAPRVEVRPEAKKGQFFQVVKTLNYDNCQMRKGYHFGITGKSDIKPNSNQMGDFLSKSTVSKIIASGAVNDFAIQQVSTTNRIAVSPALYHEQKAQVISQVHMVLIKMQDAHSKLEGPQQAINAGNLVYRYNLPSDKDNKIREGADTGASSGDLGIFWGEQASDEVSGSDEVRRSRERRSVSSEENQSGNRRRRVQGGADSSSSSSESYEDMEISAHHFQPKPGMEKAPEIPFHSFAIGNKGHSFQHDGQVNFEAEAKQLIDEIVVDLQDQDNIPKKDTLEKFDILSEIIRVMHYQQIEKVAQQLNIGKKSGDNVRQSLAYKTYRDAVAQAGTPPAVKVVFKWILEAKIEGDEAAGLLTTVSKYLRTPTPEVLKSFLALIKSEEVKKQKTLYPTALIAFTDLVRRSQVYRKSAYSYYPVQAFGPFWKELEQFASQEVIQYLTQRLQESIQQKNDQKTLLYIRALGNTGHPEMLKAFEKYIEGERQITEFQRTAMILALDKLVNTYPHTARRVTFKTYVNPALPHEMRAAAVHLLMRTNPPAEMLQRMAQYTHDDPSEIVQAAVKSAIESAAELDDEEWAELSKNAEAAKKFLNPRKYGRQNSQTYLRDYVAENLKMIYSQQLTHIVGRDSTFPRAFLYTVINKYGGLQANNIEVQAMISSVEELFRLMPNAYVPDSAESQEEGRRYTRSGSGEEWSTQNIREMLNIQSGKATELEGQLLFKILGQKRFFSFDEKMVKDLPQALLSNGLIFGQGEKLTYNKFFNRRQIVVAFPLATGYPFVYTFSMPTLAQAIGDIKGKTTPDIMQSPVWETLHKIKTVNVTAKVHLVFSGQRIAKVGFITPFARERFVAGVNNKFQWHVPLDLNINIDLQNRHINGQLNAIEQSKKFELYQASAWPYTARQKAFTTKPVQSCEDVKLIETRKSERYERTLGERTTGMAFRTVMEHQFPYTDESSQVQKTLETQGVLSLSSLPYSYYSTMQRVKSKRVFNALSFLPYGFDPTSFGLSEKQIMMILSAAPFAEDLTTAELVKLHGFMSLMTLPLADFETLDKTTQHEGILSVGNLYWPTRYLNRYNVRVTYEAERSVNRAIKFSLSFKRAFNVDKHHGSSSSRMTGPASVDEHHLAQSNDITPDSSNRRQQMLENAAYDIKQASSVAFDVSIVFEGKNSAEYITTFAHATSPADQKTRFLAFFSVKNAKKSDTKQMSVVYTSKMPQASVLSFQDALSQVSNTKANGKLQVNFAENGKPTQTKITLKATLEQSSEYKEYLRNSEIGKMCENEMRDGDYQMPGCLEATYRANVYDKISISGEVENPTGAINNITHRAVALLRQVGFWHLDENVNEKGKMNKMEAVIRIRPNLRYLNVYLQTGTMTQRFNNLPIDPALTPFLNVHQQTDMEGRASRQLFKDGNVCVIDSHKVFSFDDNIIQHEMGQCWYSAFHHVQPESRVAPAKSSASRDVAVLVRGHETEKEAMIIVTNKSGQDHVAHLKMSGSSAHLKINGQEKKISKEKSVDVYDSESHRHTQVPALRIVAVTSTEVRVEIRGELLKVIFDGKRIKVLADPSYRNNVRGLCGNYNGEQADDLITPKNCVLNNDKLFAASWAIPEQSCSADVQATKSRAEQHHCSKIEHGRGNIIRRIENGHKWSDESDSSSDSDSSASLSSEEQYLFMNRRRFGPKHNQQGGLKKCNLRPQMQYVHVSGRICFSLDTLNACPSHCRAEQKIRQRVPVLCLDSDDSLAQHYKQLIHKGVTPDHSGKKANNKITFNVPTTCTAN